MWHSSKLRVAAALALALFVGATVAQASTPTPVGLWRIKVYDDTNNLGWTGTQDICFLAGGTWFGPAFPGWSGFWFQKGIAAAGNGDHVRLLGNWNAGEGNDSAELDFTNVDLITGFWTEWTDNDSTKLWDRAMLCYLGPCVGPPPIGTLSSAPPLTNTSTASLSTLTAVCSP
jgi:hypothetical protein